MKKRIKRILLILSGSILLLSGCSTSGNDTGLEMTGMYFDTIVSVKIWGTKDTSILEQTQELCTYYENLLSRTIETSDVSRINNANGSPVSVNQETAELIETALSYCELSGGRFDITIAPLSSLWNLGHNDGQIPDTAAIEEAKSHVDYHNIKIVGNTVQLLDSEAAIDLGAIAKGYIADKIKEYLESEGVEHGLISLGGNTVVIGNKTDGSPFHLGIQKPFAEQNEIIDSVDVTDQSVVSSGTYERYFEKDGRIYHHILNPDTGYPYENNLLQVTIISEQSVDGDALSTTCFALGLEEGMRLIQNTEGVEAIFVTDDYQLHDSRTEN